MAHRLAAMGQEKYRGTTKKLPNGKVTWTGKMNLVPEALKIPLKRKKPTMYFVNSMSDLFHEDVPDSYIDQAFAVMALADWHTFQVLTKRPERMQSYLSDAKRFDRHFSEVSLLAGKFGLPFGPVDGMPHVLGNVWLGISVENKKHGLPRIPHLLWTPAAVRFLSVEPMLEAIELLWFCCPTNPGDPSACTISAPSCLCEGLHWVIVGGESGHGARPMQPDWVRSIRDQCQAAGVAFFFKQWGGVNKKAAGRVLDGREWNEMPEAKAVPA
jgi:protein gp37